MTDYTIIEKFRNAKNVRKLISAICNKGKTCYDFTERPEILYFIFDEYFDTVEEFLASFWLNNI